MQIQKFNQQNDMSYNGYINQMIAHVASWLKHYLKQVVFEQVVLDGHINI